MTCTAMTHSPTTIFGVQASVVARKDDAGARSHKPLRRSGGANTYGTTVALSTSYLTFRDVMERDPNGSIAWTQANVNSAQFGSECL